MSEFPGDQATAIVEQLPYGLVVLDGAGGVLAANAAAIGMSWRNSEGPPACCHELFACRPDGPCSHGCLVQRAAEARQALPEIRIDTRPGSPASAVWVTAAPLSDGSSVVLHLREGDARDRRRRSHPHWLKDAQLRIKVLGRTRIDTREGPLGGRWLQQRPGQILKYLIAERNRVVEAEQIAEALWPAAGREGLTSVRHYVHALRTKLEPERPRRADSSFVVTVRGGYAVNRRSVEIDADVFAQATADGMAAAARGQKEVAAELLELAMALYRGDFLEDEPYSEWAMPERDRLRSMATDALRELSGIALSHARLDAAERHLERLAAFEPFDNDIHRDLFRVYLSQGRRSEAARRFGTFRARIQREFRCEPGFRLGDLEPVVAHHPEAPWR
jgi:DNA-binding SARP family transcriptional activator